MGQKTHQKTIRQRRKRRKERIKERIRAAKDEAARNKGYGHRPS
jgi:hypothetical protein